MGWNTYLTDASIDVLLSREWSEPSDARPHLGSLFVTPCHSLGFYDIICPEHAFIKIARPGFKAESALLQGIGSQLGELEGNSQIGQDHKWFHDLVKQLPQFRHLLTWPFDRDTKNPPHHRDTPHQGLGLNIQR
jgi:hypothetical protein